MIPFNKFECIITMLRANISFEYLLFFRSFFRFNFATTCIDVEKPKCEVSIRVILLFYKLANRDLKKYQKAYKICIFD